MAALRSIERADATATGLLFEKIVVERRNQLKNSFVSKLNVDKFNGSFCFNSSTISDLSSISGHSLDSAEASFSKSLMLTPMMLNVNAPQYMP